MSNVQFAVLLNSSAGSRMVDNLRTGCPARSTNELHTGEKDVIVQHGGWTDSRLSLPFRR